MNHPNNDIEVTIANGFITIKSTNNPNASVENYNLLHASNVNEYYQDYTALNAEQPQSGRYEHNEEFTVSIDIQENPTDLIDLEFDIQDVTNQPTWTHDRAGLAQAVIDVQAGLAAASNPPIVISAPTSITPGSKVVTTALTAEPLVGAPLAIVKVDITALSTNTDAIVYGDASVVASPIGARVGTPLEPGDTGTVEIDDLSKIFIDSVVSLEGVTFNYYN